MNRFYCVVRLLYQTS